MDFGLFLPQPSDVDELEKLTTFVEAADERGFRTVWIGEHVVLFDVDQLESTYPYSEDGKSPFPAEMSWMGPFELLSFLAGRTSRVRLGTGIVLLPQRNPLYTAKSVTTLDFVSGGRADFGVGVGWMAEEYEALGVPFKGRGRRADEYIQLIRTLWTEETASFSGETYELKPAKQRPYPVQDPHPPIFIGGESDAALRRVARLGDGWFGWGLSAEQAGERLERLRPMLAENDRELDDVNLVVGSAQEENDLEELKRCAELGFDQYVLRAPLDGTAEQGVAELDRYAETFLAALAG
ncbi:MAG TPA: LLM class F420-dependent oxidoreductase [Solirubrobacterales bacterium]|jgi:probable F420-dependent oxidoreductase